MAISYDQEAIALIYATKTEDMNLTEFHKKKIEDKSLNEYLKSYG